MKTLVISLPLSLASCRSSLYRYLLSFSAHANSLSFNQAETRCPLLHRSSLVEVWPPDTSVSRCRYDLHRISVS
ncbi:hypothetical protein B0J13DRAFT_49844 [Dactylonectria estremocensis]|uniref:Uncharacterized protein n=1 Tax=Dactylonectria estremocensis TaxID=1079267 RepID=A0A9P9J5V5_9HYPO|nr:hypothetical protein B0J13DRAFT_49844 [Dactylonectria estremocensis]